MRNWLALASVSSLAVACTPAPDHVSLKLAPEVISSESGVLVADAVVLGGETPLQGWSVKLHVDYTDRNATAHTVDDVGDKSDNIGLYRGTFNGLTWEGSGLVTASVVDPAGNPALDAAKKPVTASTTFAVLDESPPTVSITAPASGSHVARGGRFTVTVSAGDEIGVSQIYVQVVTAAGNTNLDRTRSTILAGGSTNGSASFDFDAGNIQQTTSVTIYSMAADMSGNLAVSPSIPITID